ncbi:MAG: hypothetical protein U9N87_12595, partial [Planctomycetota bacterium]|nr:hypothetical protein [Planctomycetota bacterium]
AHRQAGRLADALAEEAARQNTDQRRTAARTAHENAKTATEKANSELVKTRDDYEAFVDRHLTSKLSSIPAAPLPSGTQLSQPTPGLHRARGDWAEAPESPTLTNPRWTEMDNKLTRLKARRVEMLETMTPAHPGVQNVESEIENLQRLISSVPRELARPTRDSLPAITPMPPDATDDLLAPGGEGRLSHTHTVENAKNRPKAPSLTASTTATPSELNPRLEKDFRQKQKALESARQKYDRLAVLERAAWQKLGNVQSAEVIPAVRPEMVAESFLDTASELPPRHILASLIIGLCGTVGIGMFSAGFLPPPTFANVAEVRNTLKVPVVGTMPAADLPGTERPTTNRPSLAVSGLLFLIAAVSMVITSFVIL